MIWKPCANLDDINSLKTWTVDKGFLGLILSESDLKNKKINNYCNAYVKPTNNNIHKQQNYFNN